MKTTSVCVAAALVLSWTVPAFALTDEEVDAAMQRMRAWLYSKQEETTGGWPINAEHHRPELHERGESAAVVMALLLSGESVQDQLVFAEGEERQRGWSALSRPERMARALRHLREIGFEHGFNGTYAIGLRAQAWGQLPDSYRDLLGRDAEWLLRAHRNSIFDYGPTPPTNRVDHSTTQFGILGMWEFAKRGGRVPARFWQDAMQHFVEVQNDDGGWSYDLRGDNSRGSMTAAGLTVLFIAQQQLHRGEDQPPAELTAAIERGLDWLDRRFSGFRNPNGSHHYYWLYGVERVALASGVKILNGRDWFETGARDIINNQNANGSIGGDGGSVIETSWALAFLARGRVPVWVNKLKIPDKRWNNRPNDIYFLTEYLSELYQRELNWQFVDIGSDPELWLNAPVAYIASDEAITLNAEQKQNLKKYIELGGMLVASPDGGSRRFVDSMLALARDLYPEYEPRQLEADHPIGNLLYDVPERSVKQLWGVSNGARELMVISTNDWGRSFQSERPSRRDETWQTISNLYAAATNRGNIPNRLVSPFEPRTGTGRQGELSVIQARYDGVWNVEPRAWEAVQNTLFNRSSLDLRVEQQPVEAIAGSRAALVHLAGVNEATFSDEQKQAIRDYVEAGGTVLIENVGGRGDFSLKLERQLRETFGTAAVQVPTWSPLITGEGLRGGSNIRRVVFRPYAILRHWAGSSPRLAAFMVDDRPAVIFSHEDLSLGMLGTRHWNVNGYDTESARKVVVNILLAAQQARE
ncbi:MAG: DUF4159 domain-containing protein [Phycisphaeraceae bacterium]